MATRPLPRLDETRCIRDGACVAVCPTAALGLRRHGPWLERPRACVGCGACAAVCPTGAITLGEVEVEGESPDD